MTTRTSHHDTETWALLVLGLSIGAMIAVWFGLLRDRVIPRRFGEVTANIHRSGFMSESIGEKVLASHGVRRILDLTELEYQPSRKTAERAAAARQSIEVREYPLFGDGRGSVDSYVAAVGDLIDADRTGTSVLVHCNGGSYRTGGVIASFRMLHQGWSPEDAVAEMKSYDWKPSDLLPAYLNEHLQEIADRLVLSGHLAPRTEPVPRVPLPGVSGDDDLRDQ